jgi:hypothetical protein
MTFAKIPLFPCHKGPSLLSLVGNSSFVLEVWETSDRYFCLQVQQVVLWKHEWKHARQRPPLEPYLSLDRQPRFDPKQRLC